MIQSAKLNRIFAILGVFALIPVLLFALPSAAEAKNGDFELGVSAGYNYGMPLSPSDGNSTPKAKTDGHGFAVTISPGTHVSDYIGIYADFGINVAWMQKDAVVEAITIREKDYFYAFTTLLSVKFFQPVYKGEIFESIGLGYGYSGDTFLGKDPGSAFVAKASLGYLIVFNRHFKLGAVADAMANHRTDSDYFNFSVAAQIQSFVTF